MKFYYVVIVILLSGTNQCIAAEWDEENMLNALKAQVEQQEHLEPQNVEDAFDPKKCYGPEEYIVIYRALTQDPTIPKQWKIEFAKIANRIRAYEDTKNK